MGNETTTKQMFSLALSADSTFCQTVPPRKQSEGRDFTNPKHVQKSIFSLNLTQCISVPIFNTPISLETNQLQANALKTLPRLQQEITKSFITHTPSI